MEHWTSLIFKNKIHPTYFVSNFGRVMNKYGKILKQRLDKNKKYLTIQVYYNKKFIVLPIHKAVFRSFNPNIKIIKGYVVDHRDNNRDNNRLDNLQYITHRENSSKDRVSKSDTPVGVTVCNDQYREKKYQANIRVSDKRKYLGRYHTKTEARLAYLKELVSLGEFREAS